MMKEIYNSLKYIFAFLVMILFFQAFMGEKSTIWLLGLIALSMSLINYEKIIMLIE